MNMYLHDIYPSGAPFVLACFSTECTKCASSRFEADDLKLSVENAVLTKKIYNIHQCT